VRNAAPLADALTAAGVATWNVEYRRYDHPGGGWPGTFLDVARATDHVRTLAASYPLDTLRVLAIGHSAGAQIAAWLPTRARLGDRSELSTPAPLALHAVVALGGVMDLAEYQRRQLETCGNPAIESVMGGLPSAVPERYRDVSPIERLPLGVPHVHVAGALDRIAPREVTLRFAESARARGDSVEVVTVPALGHHDVMSPRSEAGKAAIDAVVRLLRAVAGPRPPGSTP
jgi:acetyl esterase/lipase